MSKHSKLFIAPLVAVLFAIGSVVPAGADDRGAATAGGKVPPQQWSTTLPADSPPTIPAGGSS